MQFQVSMSKMTGEASKLLDFNQTLDISLLDNVIGCMYNGIGEQVCFQNLYMYDFNFNILKI